VPDNIEDIKDRVNEISFNSSLALEIQHLEFINDLVDKGITMDGKFKKINLHALSADNALGNLNLSSKLNTNWDFLMHLKTLGYKACDNWIEKNFDNIGKCSTYTL
jgi:NTE family protein